jgi:ketosteroid isomerase-like protein
VSDEDVQLVVGVFADALQETGRIEMGAMIADDEVWTRNLERFSTEAQISFITPDGSALGAMGEPFRGIEGLRAGWREWLEPWDEFHVVMADAIDTGEGQVLVLADATGRMRGTGAEVPQEVAALCRVEGEKIVAIGFYLDQGQARREAGLD